MGLFTRPICFAQGGSRVFLSGCRVPCVWGSSVHKQEWSAVALFAQRPSAFRTCLAGLSPRPFFLREEIENGERHRELIDPAPNDPAICEEGGKRAREKEGGTRGSNKYLGD